MNFLERFAEDTNGDGDRAMSSSLNTSMISSIFSQIVKFLIRSFMGEEWLSQDIALRRLDDLKTSLFKYYARKNIFGGTVEQARDGIGFPSLEGAVLSLAFLTFSVFLIDLILNVLNRLRLKSAATVATGREFSPSNASPYYHNAHTDLRNSTFPVSMEMLTTLSSKVLSAIEKPWQ